MFELHNKSEQNAHIQATAHLYKQYKPLQISLVFHLPPTPAQSLEDLWPTQNVCLWRKTIVRIGSERILLRKIVLTQTIFAFQVQLYMPTFYYHLSLPRWQTIDTIEDQNSNNFLCFSTGTQTATLKQKLSLVESNIKKISMKLCGTSSATCLKLLHRPWLKYFFSFEFICTALCLFDTKFSPFSCLLRRNSFKIDRPH